MTSKQNRERSRARQAKGKKEKFQMTGEVQSIQRNYEKNMNDNEWENREKKRRLKVKTIANTFKRKSSRIMDINSFILLK